MRLDEVQKMVRRVPFEPFTVQISEGANYPVHYPDQLLIAPRTLFVGIRNGHPGSVVQDVVICDLAHVTRLAPLKGRPRRRAR